MPSSGQLRDPVRHLKPFKDSPLGRIPADWSQAPLGQLAFIYSGGTPSRTVPAYWHGDIPWVTPRELTGLKTKYLNNTLEKVTKAGLASCAATLVPTNSLLVTTRATIGSVALAAMSIATNQGFRSLVFRAQADPHFFYHLTSRLVREFRRRASGTTFLEISGREFAAVEAPLPPLPEQRRIAEILDTLDEVIRHTEQLIAKLQQMKQGLLHDLLTRGIDDNGELRDPVRHPEQFKDSPLGKIPRDWRVESLGDATMWLSGGTPSRSISGFWGGTIPWVRPKDMKVFRLGRARKNVTTAGVAAGSRMTPEGSVLVVVRGMILAHSFPVCLTTSPVAFNQDVKAVIPARDVEATYLAHWFVGKAQDLLGLVTEATHGTKRIDLDDLQDVAFAVPPTFEQRLIAGVLDCHQERVSAEIANLDTLRALKHGLMDDLLTGRVRVNVPQEAA